MSSSSPTPDQELTSGQEDIPQLYTWANREVDQRLIQFAFSKCRMEAKLYADCTRVSSSDILKTMATNGREDQDLKEYDEHEGIGSEKKKCEKCQHAFHRLFDQTRTITLVWKCREQRNTLNDCLKQYTGDQAKREEITRQLIEENPRAIYMWRMNKDLVAKVAQKEKEKKEKAEMESNQSSSY